MEGVKTITVDDVEVEVANLAPELQQLVQILNSFRSDAMRAAYEKLKVDSAVAKTEERVVLGVRAHLEAKASEAAAAAEAAAAEAAAATATPTA